MDLYQAYSSIISKYYGVDCNTCKTIEDVKEDYIKSLFKQSDKPESNHRIRGGQRLFYPRYKMWIESCVSGCVRPDMWDKES